MPPAIWGQTVEPGPGSSGITPCEAWPTWSTLLASTRCKALQRVCRSILPSIASALSRETLNSPLRTTSLLVKQTCSKALKNPPGICAWTPPWGPFWARNPAPAYQPQQGELPSPLLLLFPDLLILSYRCSLLPPAFAFLPPQHFSALCSVPTGFPPFQPGLLHMDLQSTLGSLTDFFLPSFSAPVNF